MNTNEELIEDVEEPTCECPSCGEGCCPSDLLPGGSHFVYSEGHLAGYCEKSLYQMTDRDLGYSNDELVECKKHGVYIPFGLDCPLCLADELCDEEDCLEEASTADNDCVYERDDRDPTYWRTNQTEALNQLNEHAPDCRCQSCAGDPPYDEEDYQRHIANEGGNAWNSNPDGCFFCGGDHHSDCCPERY